MNANTIKHMTEMRQRIGIINRKYGLEENSYNLLNILLIPVNLINILEHIHILEQQISNTCKGCESMFRKRKYIFYCVYVLLFVFILLFYSKIYYIYIPIRMYILN